MYADNLLPGYRPLHNQPPDNLSPLLPRREWDQRYPTPGRNTGPENPTLERTRDQGPGRNLAQVIPDPRTPRPLPIDRHTLVKTLPSRNFGVGR